MKHRYNIDMVRWSHYDESCVKGLNWKWNIKLFEVWGRGSLQKKKKIKLDPGFCFSSIQQLIWEKLFEYFI